MELMKLFDFILENKSIIKGDNSLFSIDTLAMIRAIVKGKISNNFELTAAQKQLLIDAFINSDNYFTDDTPEFILENDACIRLAVERNISSVYYIKNVSPELESFIIDKAIEHKYILKDHSPFCLKSNYDVSLNSVKLDGLSADYINWNDMTEDQIDNLVDAAVSNGYILSSESCSTLTKNKKVVLQSVKKNMDTIKYASDSVKDHPDIFKYLLLNGYPYSKSYVRNRNLKLFLDAEVMEYCFKQKGIFGNDDDNKTYISRFVKLYNDAINTFPQVKTFESVFQMVAEEKWKDYKTENIDYYENIFGKICSQLRNSNDFEDAVRSLDFTSNMKDILEEKYAILYESMKEYFNIFHSNTSNKLAKMEVSQNTIAKLSALYVSKSKEKYKKQELEAYYKWIKSYFTLRLDHPLINKKVIQNKKKEKFKRLYQHGDKEVTKFLIDISKSYSELLDINTVAIMVDRFVNYGESNLDCFIYPPDKYSHYERYEKAIKLIHRLNSGYIKYDGVELTNYRDIIKLDAEKQKYVYTGVTFNEDDLKAYNEYRKRERIFKKIKKDIILKIRTIEINTHNNSDIIKSLSEELPFTDEYFIFDSEYTLSNFSFSTFLHNCFDDDGLEIEPFLSDEAFANVYNAIVNNGLIWLLLFMTKNANSVLKSKGIDKDNILGIIDYMMEITEIAKEFNFNLSNFAELVLVNKISQCADASSVAILGKEVIEKLYKFKDFTDDEDEENIISMAKKLVCEMTKRSKSTVPFVSGQTMNYSYSVYDSQDETLLLAGINTDACFRIAGTDNDFLHYCALNKNGFVIKITDTFGNFIGRGSGFRNGNCVFINQLRTIYDEGGIGYSGEYENERNDIIETLKKACEDIVSTSHENPNEKNKIDHVFVTRSYSLEAHDFNVTDEVSKKIGDHPMDNKSENWRDFLENTDNLKYAEDDGYFETDYGSYPLICLASSKKIETLTAEDIKPNNVKAVYERPRNKIIIATEQDPQILRKINKINGIKAFFECKDFKTVEVPEYSTIFTGDNWYIIFNGGNIISSCVLDFDRKAQIEFNLIKDKLAQYVSSNQQQFNIDQVVDNLQPQSSDDAMILKLHKNNPNS